MKLKPAVIVASCLVTLGLCAAVMPNTVTAIRSVTDALYATLAHNQPLSTITNAGTAASRADAYFALAAHNQAATTITGTNTILMASTNGTGTNTTLNGTTKIITNQVSVATVTNSLTAGNLLLSSNRWVDSAMIFNYGTGGTAPARTALAAPYAEISTLGFADADKLDFMTQINHDIAPSNSTGYVAPHLHVLPLIAPPADGNLVKLTIVYVGAALNGVLQAAPITNTVDNIALTTNKHTLVTFSNLLFTNFYPGISGKFWGTITRSAASASNFSGKISLDGDFHYPVDRLGSTTDSAP